MSINKHLWYGSLLCLVVAIIGAKLGYKDAAGWIIRFGITLIQLIIINICWGVIREHHKNKKA